MSLQHSLCFLTGAIPNLKSSSGTTVQGSLDNTDDESPEGNSGLHPNEHGNSRGCAKESDGNENLDSSSQSNSEEDCDPEEAKILSGPMPSIHQDFVVVRKTQVNPSSAFNRTKHHQSDPSNVPGILGSNYLKRAYAHTSKSFSTQSNRILSNNRI